MMIHDNILRAVGRTPMVAINRLNPNPNVKILAKIEFFNPGGSIKDRVALAMVEAAVASGEMQPGKVILEATSGNTGIGLAMVCAVKGLPITLLMPETASIERRRIMAAFGADIRLTPGHLATDGAIEEAYRLAREEPDKYVLVDQYNNPASIEAHYQGTGQEMWDQTGGELTHVIVSLGTTGTIMGCAKRLKELNPDISIVAMEPYMGHKIQGLKNMQESYPPGIYDKSAVDRFMHIEDEEAFETVRRLAREEGLFVGMSSGASMAAALRLAQELDSGTIVALLPDSGERYLSTPLFEPPPKEGVGLFDLAAHDTTFPAPGPEGFGLFTMGPALDNLDDLEFWRRLALLDVLARYMRFKGGQAKVVVGLADMDDRALEAARNQNLSREEFSRQAVATLTEMAKARNMDSSVVFHPAGQSMDTAQDLIRSLMARGAAYEKLRSVYFDVLRFSDYGSMSRMDLSKLATGKTVDLADYVKDNPKDFTLFKRASLKDLKAGDFLATDWGNGRPSWFLQLAATALDKLPEMTVFLAGQAHLFPHMENFRAIWSLGRKYAPKAWLATHPTAASQDSDQPALPEGAALRMWLLSTSYHKPLTISEDSFTMWGKNLAKVRGLAAGLTEAASQKDRGSGSPLPETEQALVNLRCGLRRAMEEDLSLHRFWPALFKFCRDIQQLLAESLLSPSEARTCLEALTQIDQVLGALDMDDLPLPESEWPPAVKDLLAERAKARAAKDFSRADALRDEIASTGYRVEDGPKGPRLHKM
ncbi:MAG: cysteine synthase [Desulfovibrio sp.]|nr:MAG: cysteine synthase [Desulfovibrio sp.]